jgi:hypothetical protein
MRFYNQQHPFYCGVDLHAKTMHLCVLFLACQVMFLRRFRMPLCIRIALVF